MSQKLQLSVVDQSPMREGSNAGVALRETIQLAVATERMGYQRYWVAEHHNLPNFAGTAPEVMVGQIAAHTKSIRVGSGGVMLPHYSALKVAETFRILDSLYPDRIDLGIGRAPGSDQITAAALAYPSMPKDVRHFPQQVRDVINYLNDTQPDDHPFNEVLAAPEESETVPQVWLLGSRYESAFMAAKMGLPFAYAHFFGMGATDGPQIVESYRQNFEASEYLSEPLVNVGVQVLCADTEEEARRIADPAGTWAACGQLLGAPRASRIRMSPPITSTLPTNGSSSSSTAATASTAIPSRSRKVWSRWPRTTRPRTSAW